MLQNAENSTPKTFKFSLNQVPLLEDPLRSPLQQLQQQSQIEIVCFGQLVN